MIPLLSAAAVAQAPLIAAPPAPPAAIEAAPPPIIVASRRWVKTPGDPHERFNRDMFKVHNKIDHALLRPASMGYQHVVPRFLRSAIRNFFGNLGEPAVFVNFLLQHKVGRAVKTVVRFGINSTIGLGGTIDAARGKAFELPHQPNGFGDTLGFYGVKPGAYFFLPLIGPTTIRDFLGGQADGLLLLAVGKPFNQLYFQIPRAVLTGLDMRAEADGDLRALMSTALDPYATLRSVYLQDRAGEIAALKGRKASDEDPSLVDPLADPAGPVDPAAPADPAAAAPADPATPADPTAAPAAPASPKAPSSTAPELSDPLADPAADPAAPVQR